MKNYRSSLKVAISLLLCLIITLGTFHPVQAAENKKLKVNFSEFYFETNDYDPNKVNVVDLSNENEEIFEIRDNETGKKLDTFKVNKQVIMNRSNTSPYIFHRFQSFGGTELHLQVFIQLYSNGSFRQIDSYQGNYLGISSQVTTTSIEDKSVSVWNPNGTYPTLKLYYAYGGTLVAIVDSSATTSVKADLLSAGFSFSHSVSGKTYYRRSFNSSGSLGLY